MTVPQTNGSGPADIMEAVLTKGDLAKLTPQERNRYYAHVCESVGLNPLTKPFEFLELNRKLILYATKSCTEQLRKIHGVSVVEMTRQQIENVHIVTVKVQDKVGRTDMSTGAVTIGNLKGDALANNLMKAETKAKRRATLSICGLGFLDETEIETIPGARPVEPPPPEAESPIKPQKLEIPDVDPVTGETGPREIPMLEGPHRWINWGQAFLAHVEKANDVTDFSERWAKNNNHILDMADKAPKVHARLIARLDTISQKFPKPEAEETFHDPEQQLEELERELAECQSNDDVAEVNNKWDQHIDAMFPPDAAYASKLIQETYERVVAGK